MNNYPIGIVDSGVGGLSIWKELKKQLPKESLIYLADQKNFPYGKKKPDQLYKIVAQKVKKLISFDVKLIVIACNTATVHTIGKLRENFSLPIVGIVPVVKKAAELSRKKRIAVLATSATAKSLYLKKLIEAFASDCQVFIYEFDGVIEQIEKGLPIYFGQELIEVLGKDVDVVTLGCTHYSFIKPHLEKVFGKNIVILDSASAIARQVKRVLTNNGMLASGEEPRYTFYTTGNVKNFKKQLKLFFGKKLPVVKL